MLLKTKYDYIEKYARKCSKTGKGINEGFCFNDGEKYFKEEYDAILYAKELGYNSLDEAYEDEGYYWTDLEIEEGEVFYDEDGNKYNN